MYGNEDSFVPTLVGELVAAGFGYGIGSYSKKKPGSYVPIVIDGVAIVAGAGLKGRMNHPTAKAVSEAVGSAGSGIMGLIIAANTPTPGGMIAGSIPLNRSAHTASFGRVVRGNPAVVVNNPPVRNFGWTPFNELGYTG